MSKARDSIEDLKTIDANFAAKAPLASPVFTGNVGIGVTPEAWTTFRVLQLGGEGVIRANTATNEDFAFSRNVYYDGSWKRINTAHAQEYLQDNSGSHLFKVAPSGTADAAISWTTAMTINNSGTVGINRIGPQNSERFAILGNTGSQCMSLKSPITTAYDMVNIINGNGQVGSIQTSGTSTSYNTSSDYRLKENVTPMSGATAQTKLLKPCNFDWIAGGNVNGFIAHELAEVVPEAVTGTKDAMMDEEYEVTAATDTEAAVMGTRSVPNLQGIDQSKLVPLLTATIQELITRIEALEA